jgi:hypothetical protein
MGPKTLRFSACAAVTDIAARSQIDRLCRANTVNRTRPVLFGLYLIMAWPCSNDSSLQVKMDSQWKLQQLAAAKGL